MRGLANGHRGEARGVLGDAEGESLGNFLGGRAVLGSGNLDKLLNLLALLARGEVGINLPRNGRGDTIRTEVGRRNVSRRKRVAATGTFTLAGMRDFDDCAGFSRGERRRHPGML
jgi:hypothetical protein